MEDSIFSALIGVAVADAVGVPYEFKSRKEVQRNPATDMRGFGTYNLPPGTWSDDTSLTLCLADSLSNGYNLTDMARKFIAWRDTALWTAEGEVFDIGNTTNSALSELKTILTNKKFDQLTELKHYANESDNGNGALMRIIPLLFYIKGKPIDEQFKIIWEVAALTHKHIRSALACLIYLKFAELMLDGLQKENAYSKMRADIRYFFEYQAVEQKEIRKFDRLIAQDIRVLNEVDIESSGYVLHTLEASIWCFMKTQSYSEAVLTAVNLGNDTDTTAAVTGGLAALCYGYKSIPISWREQTARVEDIQTLAKRLNAFCSQNL